MHQSLNNVIVSVILILGIYTGDGIPEDESLFITEKHCFQDLVSGLGTPCPCGMARNTWILESVIQVHANVCTNNKNIIL